MLATGWRINWTLRGLSKTLFGGSDAANGIEIFTATATATALVKFDSIAQGASNLEV